MTKYNKIKAVLVNRNIIKEDGVFLKGHDVTNKWFWKPIYLAVNENSLFGTYDQFPQDFTFEPGEIKSMAIVNKGKKIFVDFEIRDEFVKSFNGFKNARLRLKIGKFPAEKVLNLLSIFKSFLNS